MTSADVANAFTSTRESLEKAGIENDFFLDLIASRLLIERVGESNNQDWWESRVLSETGRARLSEVTPKTQLKSRITLAVKVGRKAESDQLPDDSISLFSFGPQMESRLTAVIEEMENDEELALGVLEDLTIQSLEKGWTDDIISETGSNISPSTDSESNPNPGLDESYLVDDSGYVQGDIESNKWRILTTLLQGYGQCTDQLQVPYYSLESELKSENA